MQDFVWRVAAEYGWGDGTDLEEQGLYLMAHGKNLVPREYRPTDVPDLFLKFAFLDPTRDRLLAFATEYGHPTSPVSVADRTASPERAEFQRKLNLAPTEADRLALLPYEVREPPTITLLDLQVVEMRKAVKEWAKLDEKRGRRNYGPLAQLISEQLEGRVGFRMIQDTDRTVRLEPTPKHLLGFLWMQFAEAVVESTRRRFNFCEGCRAWLDLAKEAGPGDRKCRGDRRYCGEACRARAYRQRRLTRRSSR